MAKYLKNLFKFLIFPLVLALVTLTCAAAISNIESETTAYDNINFLVLSDLHLDINQATPMTINPSLPTKENGVDTTTFVTMLNKIKNTFPQPPFIIITGDIAGYDSTCTYQDEVFVLQHINEAYPDTPKILIFGNTDSLETPYGPFYSTNAISGVHSTYELAMQNGWIDGFLSTGNVPGTYPRIIDEDTTNGNFSLYLTDKLRVIAFNSIVFSSRTENTASRETGQFVLIWIADQVKNAVANNEKILFATHIPCGNDISNLYNDDPFWRQQYQEQNTFYTLLSRYHENIIGILCGHTHQDELKALQSASHKNVGIILVTPSFLTKNGNAPGVKSFYLSKIGSNWAISDYITYNFVGDSSNFSFQQLYDFDNYYGIKSDQNIINYLSKITVSKMSRYFTAGNPNYTGGIAYPYDILITLP